MPRERIAPGDFGKITVSRRGELHVAKCRTRDRTGVLRLLECSGASGEAARRKLQQKVRGYSPPTGAEVGAKTTCSELFDVWIGRKDKLGPRTRAGYEYVWERHGAPEVGSLLLREVTAARADRMLRDVAAKSVNAARQLRTCMTQAFALAVRFDAVAANPFRETERPTTVPRPARALTAVDLGEVLSLAHAYRSGQVTLPDGTVATRPGPRPGRHLPEILAVLAGTGCRFGEVLALRWQDVDLAKGTATLCGTVVRPGRGAPVRQDHRKGGAPELVVALPRFVLDALRSLPRGVGAAPVFPNRGGGWLNEHNVRDWLRCALSAAGDGKFSWVTPHTFRRTVATVVRYEHGVDGAQLQLGHASNAVTQRHYVERRTAAPDHSTAIQAFVAGGN